MAEEAESSRSIAKELRPTPTRVDQVDAMKRAKKNQPIVCGVTLRDLAVLGAPRNREEV
jgi:hypothetical protein